MTKHNPQNPYQSMMVEASAGSGKTFQLAARFLHIVATGCKPWEVLTLTFTVKAAAEMRSRIIAESAQLLHSPKQQDDFDRRMLEFHKDSGEGFPLPLSAAQTAAAIISSTQLLSITTIDSLFNEWVAKFPWEASTCPGAAIPIPFQICDAAQNKDIATRAWDLVIQNLTTGEHSRLQELLDHGDLPAGTLSLEVFVRELERFDSYLWEKAEQALLPLPNIEAPTWPELIRKLTPAIDAAASLTSRHEAVTIALHQGHLEALLATKFLTKDLRISQTYLRGKKREQASAAVKEVEEAFERKASSELFLKLNELGSFSLNLFEKWRKIKAKLKKQAGLTGFDDLLKASWHLFSGEDNHGISWLIQKGIRHLLIDEFQDTSSLQWQIFSRLSEEILSGQGAHSGPQSVFLVGDRKQAIYGFREADPIVVDHAAALLERFEYPVVEMNDSFRSAQCVLDYVNRVFAQNLLPCPKHATAALDGRPFVPDVGRVDMAPLIDEKDQTIGTELEARLVADMITHRLSEANRWPVRDSITKNWRPLQASDICILYRGSTRAHAYAYELRKRGLRYQREGSRGFFTRTEINDVFALLRFLVCPADSVALLTFLRSPLLNQAILIPSDHDAWSTSESLLTEIANHSPDLRTKIEQVRTASLEQTPFALLSTISKTFSFDDLPAAMPTEEQFATRRNLERLHTLALEAQNQGIFSTSGFFDFLSQARAADEVKAANPTDVISMMTIHKAKGLEFPWVVLIEAGEAWWRPDRYWVKSPDRTGLSFVGSAAQRSGSFPQLEERVQWQEQGLREEAARLLYVALTRSSQYLSITGHRTRTTGGSFFEELWQAADEVEGSKLRSIQGKDQATITSNAISSENLPTHVWPTGQDQFIFAPGGNLDSAKTSGDTPPEIARGLGILIHEALQASLLQKSWDFNTQWEHHLGTLQGSEFWKKSTHEEINRNLQNKKWLSLFESGDIYTEAPIYFGSGTRLLRGSIDLLVIRPQSIIVIELKTGAVEKTWKETVAQRGYRKQLDAYLQAVRKIQPPLQVQGVLWSTKLCEALIVD